MWTHQIVKSSKVDHLRLSVDVAFTNGATTKTITFAYSDPSSLPGLIRNQLAQYNTIEAAELPVDGEAIDLTIPDIEPPVVTPEDKRRQVLALADQKRQEALALVAAKGLQANDAYVVKVQTAFEVAAAAVAADVKAADG